MVESSLLSPMIQPFASLVKCARPSHAELSSLGTPEAGGLRLNCDPAKRRTLLESVRAGVLVGDTLLSAGVVAITVGATEAPTRA